LLNDTKIDLLFDKLNALEASVNTIAEMLQKEKIILGDWLSEKETIAATGLSRSTLLKLRKLGKISSSTITGKQLYYKKTDFIKLLNKNEQEA
jgi:Mg2+ and Co2+ transporter CorA